MKQRGRKSAASLSVVTITPGKRPDPPESLTPDQAAIWRDVVASKPVDWFTADSLPLLVAYCKAIAVSAVISHYVDDFDPALLADDEGLDRYNRLTRMFDRQARLAGLLATKMRLTQQSRYRADKADTLHRQTGQSRKPWEFGDE